MAQAALTRADVFLSRRSIALATRAPRSSRRAHRFIAIASAIFLVSSAGTGCSGPSRPTCTWTKRLHEKEGAHIRAGAHGGGGDGPGRHGRCAQGGPVGAGPARPPSDRTSAAYSGTSSSAQAAAKALSLSHGRRFRRDAVAADRRAGDRHRPAVCARQSARRRGRRRKRLRGPVGSRARPAPPIACGSSRRATRRSSSTAIRESSSRTRTRRGGFTLS